MVNHRIDLAFGIDGRNILFHSILPDLRSISVCVWIEITSTQINIFTLLALDTELVEVSVCALMLQALFMDKPKIIKIGNRLILFMYLLYRICLNNEDFLMISQNDGEVVS